MKKISFFFICFLLFPPLVKAEEADSTWTMGGFASLSFNQVGLTNWAGGGESSLSGTTVLNGFIKYKGPKSTWDNSLDLGYGILRSDKETIRKNEDKIDLNSKYGWHAKGKFDYSTLLNFKSQFAPGYNYPNDSAIVSKFTAPAFLTIAIGMDYNPKNFFSLYLSPASGKYTFITDQKLADEGAFGVEGAKYDPLGNKIAPGKRFRPEFGAYLKAKFQKKITGNINALSSLILFNNYTDKKKLNRKNIDISWETIINIKANKFLTTSISSHLIYDNDIIIPTYEKINGIETKIGEGPKLQFKEVLGVGLSYKF